MVAIRKRKFAKTPVEPGDDGPDAEQMIGEGEPGVEAHSPNKHVKIYDFALQLRGCCWRPCSERWKLELISCSAFAVRSA